MLDSCMLGGSSAKDLKEISCWGCRMRPTRPLLLRLMPQRRALVNTQNAKSPTVSTRPLQTRICLLPFGTLGDFAPKCQPQKKQKKQSMNESAGRFCALFWDISVGTDQQVDKHAPSPEWCSRRGSECHQWAFDGFIFGRINMSLTSILPEKDWHWLDLLWSRVKKKEKKSHTASPSAMQFTTPAAKLLI